MKFLILFITVKSRNPGYGVLGPDTDIDWETGHEGLLILKT